MSSPPHPHAGPLVYKEELTNLKIYGSKKLVQLKAFLIPEGGAGYKFMGIGVNPMGFSSEGREDEELDVSHWLDFKNY